MSAPSILLLLTGVACIPSLLLRERRTMQSVISILAAALIAWVVFALPLDQPIPLFGMDLKFGSRWVILGRSLTLTESTRAAVGMLYASVALLYAGALVTRAPDVLHILGFAMVGTVAAALMIEPIVFAALLFEIAAIFALLLLSGERGKRPRGAFRLLSLFSLGMIAILLTGWMLEDLGGPGLVPQDRRILLLLGMGFAVLMAVPPFHSWLPVVVEDNDPIAISLVVTILQGGGFFFMLSLLGAYDFLGDQILISDLLRMTGTATAIVAGSWAVSQSSPGKAFGYGLIAHIGVSMICAGLGDVQGIQLSAAMTALRTLHLLTWSLGEDEERLNETGTEQEFLEPKPGMVFLIRMIPALGFLGLAGFPLTPGYAYRWTFLNHLSILDPIALGASVFAMLSLILSSARTVLMSNRQVESRSTSISRRRLALLVFYLGLLILVTFFPQILLSWMDSIVSDMIRPIS